MKKILSLLIAGGLAFSGSSQLDITATATPFTIDFDNNTGGVLETGPFNASGFDNPGAAGQLNSNAWEILGLQDGDLFFGGTQVGNDFARGTATGNVTSGGIYAFDITGSGDFAFGCQPTGSDFTPSTITLQIQNNTGTDVQGLAFSYDLYVNNDQGRANAVTLEYSYDNSNFTAVPAFNYVSTEVADALGFVANNLSSTIDINLPDGDPIYIRWTFDDVSGGGSRDEFALDNISATFIVPPTVEFASTDYLAHENDGTIDLELTISNTNGSPSSVIVMPITGSPATDPADYTVAGTVVNFSGTVDETVTYTITLVDDGTAEKTEYVGFRILPDANAVPEGDDYTALHILDDDYMAPVGNGDIQLEVIDTYTIGSGSTEISALDTSNMRLYIANSINNELEIVDMTDPYNMVQIATIDVSMYGSINSVAVWDGLVVLAMENSNPQMDGSVVFMDEDGIYINDVTVGAMPDMVTFTPDHMSVLTANEGEPDTDYIVDPEGSISIIDLSSGPMTATVTTLDFTGFNSQTAALVTAGVQYYPSAAGLGSTLSQDLEPEYITIDNDGTTAWVTLQENNAIAKVDLTIQTITDIYPLGFKDHSLTNNSLDASDDHNDVLLTNWPVMGRYQPDAISSFEIGGVTYLVTANEGDAREYNAVDEDGRMDDLDLNDAVFGDWEDILMEDYHAGRIKISTEFGDADMNGEYDTVFTYGARSFSIWNGNDGTLVYDSGDDFEQITAADPVYGAIFNCSNDDISFKDRSDAKGPEPEGVATGWVNDTAYAFITLERMGGIMVYNVNDPVNPQFVQYINNRDVAAVTGDLGPEDIIFVSDHESPIDTALVIVSNEVSGTVSIFKVNHYMFFQPTAVFTEDATAICEGESVIFNDNTTEELTDRLWTFEGGTPATSSNASETVTYNSSGNFGVKLVVRNPAGVDSVLIASHITVNPNPAEPTITQIDATTIESSSATTYQWNDMGGPVAGETNQQFNPSADGDYTVTITDVNGCAATSTTFTYSDWTSVGEFNGEQLYIYPNPANDVIYISHNINFVIVDMAGKVVQNSNGSTTIDISNLTEGVYILKAENGTQFKFIKQ